VQLKLVQCLQLVRINAWNSENVLQKVVIQYCDCLEFLPPLQNISEFVLTYSDDEQLRCCNFRIGKQKKLSYQGESLSFWTLQTMVAETSFHGSLEELKLDWGFLPAGFTDFFLCGNTSVLELSYNEMGMTTTVALPHVFYGKQIKLSGFNLSDWHVQQHFPNLQKCRVFCCNGFVALPEMPMLTDLTVTHSSDLSAVQSYPNLISLCLRSNKILSTILSSPNLIQVEISSVVVWRIFPVWLV
jgi:hypothetical protein